MTVYIVYSEVRERTPDEDRTVMQTSLPKKTAGKRSPRKAIGAILVSVGLVLTVFGAKNYFSSPGPSRTDEEVQAADVSEQPQEAVPDDGSVKADEKPGEKSEEKPNEETGGENDGEEIPKMNEEASERQIPDMPENEADADENENNASEAVLEDIPEAAQEAVLDSKQ